jgi:glycosyltransferase involved in cell wall biosynthesis
MISPVALQVFVVRTFQLRHAGQLDPRRMELRRGNLTERLSPQRTNGMPTCAITLALPDGTGAPRMAVFFCKALAEAGHRVVLVCGDVPPAARDAGGRMLEEMRRFGVQIQMLPALRQLTRPGTVASVREIVAQEGADCLISFQQRDQITALWAAYGAGVPCIVSAQNQYTFWGYWPVRKLKETMFACSTRRLTSLAVCTSEAVQRELVERFGLAREKTTVLPNGVDVRGFPEFSSEEKARARASLGVADDELLLINVGRIDVQKGQDLLIEAFRGVPSRRRLKLVLVGGVSRGGNAHRMQVFYGKIRERVATAGLADRVIFAGWREDVPLLLSAADCYVHAARWEGWPLVLIEAMAARLPVISTNCAGRPHGFEDGVHGMIVPSGQVEPLQSAMQDLIQVSEVSRTRMGAAARRLAETHYDIRALSRRFVKVVEETMHHAS